MLGESDEEEATHLHFEPKSLVSLQKKKKFKKVLNKNRGSKQDGVKLFANCRSPFCATAEI